MKFENATVKETVPNTPTESTIIQIRDKFEADKIV